MILPRIHAARDEGGAVPRGPDEIAGGSFSVNVKGARGFKMDLVGPRT